MAKKFNTEDATASFFSQAQEQPQQAQEGQTVSLTQEQLAQIIAQSKQILDNAQPEKKPVGRPKKTEEQKLRGRRFSLMVDKDLGQYMKEKAWQDRKTITQYINDLIRADMEEYFKNGGTKDGWETEKI